MSNMKRNQCWLHTAIFILWRLMSLSTASGNIKKRQYMYASNSDGSTEQKPAAHLMGSPQRQDLNQAPGSEFTIGLWNQDDDLAFIHDVTYRYGRLVIPEDGFYYVYSQVAFSEALPIGGSTSVGNPDGLTESPSLSHYLYRYNVVLPNGGEEKLIQNSITKCSQGPGEYTSYLGAVFHLRRADDVFVKVSNLTMLSRNPKSNYFGLFKV